MIYRIRIILDTKDDVLRDLEIKSNSSFEELHFAIVDAFNLKGNEMKQFFRSYSYTDILPKLTFEL